MRGNLFGLLLAIVAAVIIVGVAIVLVDGNKAEAPPTEDDATPSPTVSITATPSARGPSVAPAGRTSDAALNRIIDDFVSMTSAELAENYGDVLARNFSSVAGPDVYPTVLWTRRLAGAQRSLYSVMKADPQEGPGQDYNVILSVTPQGESQPVAWRIPVLNGKPVQVEVGDGELANSTGDVGSNYDRFLVLPPKSDLPQPPPSHHLTMRTGVAAVDGILELLQNHDSQGLLDLGTTPMAARHCGSAQVGPITPAPPELRDVAMEAVGLDSVVVVPLGYPVVAEHEIIVLLQTNPYSWQYAALFERNGHISGVDGCADYALGDLYPPRGFPVPPVDDLAHLDENRRSGIPVIDAFLDALQGSDDVALSSMIDYEELACTTQSGLGGPPSCEGDEPEGTQLNVVLSMGCEGVYVRQDWFQANVDNLMTGKWALYAVADLGPPAMRGAGFLRGQLEVVVMAPDNAGPDPFLNARAFFFSEKGVTAIRYSCGAQDPYELIWPSSSPNFLLPPP